MFAASVSSLESTPGIVLSFDYVCSFSFPSVSHLDRLDFAALKEVWRISPSFGLKFN